MWISRAVAHLRRDAKVPGSAVGFCILSLITSTIAAWNLDRQMYWTAGISCAIALLSATGTVVALYRRGSDET